MPKIELKNLKDPLKRIRAITFVMTKQCNLKCKYCYEKNSLRDNDLIDIDLVKSTLEKYLNSDDEYTHIYIDLFGGEPFLAFHLIKRIVEFVKSKKWKKKFHIGVSTNGTILNEEIKEWLYENRHEITVGLSFDGSKIAQDLGRDNSYNIVIKNLPFFRKTWPKQFIKCTFCADTIPFVSKSIIDMEEMNLLFTANLPFEDIWGNQKNKKRLLKVYEDQLSILIDYYTEHFDLFPPERILNYKFELLNKEKTLADQSDNEVRFCGAGREMMLVDIDGGIYPCHRFSDWITHRQLPKDPQNVQKKWEPDECNECKILPICPTCVGYNFEVNGDCAKRTTFHCDSLKIEVLSSAKLEANRIAQKMKDFSKIPKEEYYILKKRLDVIFDFIEKGI